LSGKPAFRRGISRFAPSSDRFDVSREFESRMNPFRNGVLALGTVALGLLAAAPAAHAASLVQVPRATWGATGVPAYMQLWIYVPDQRAAKPPIYISCHSCGSTASGQINNIPMAKAQADAQGFILLIPDNPGQNCWDVGTTAALRHDGGGDTHAVAQMIQYVIRTYNADPNRVYIQGGSGGAMLVQAMLAVYPDLIRAGSARAGVPAGCWADGYAASNQWSNTCAAGSVNKTAQQWGDLARAMYPGYTGHRPRLQSYQGDADATISYNNTREAIEQWTNVLGLSMTPTTMDTGYRPTGSTFTYNRQFWKNSCGQQVLEIWTSPGAGHSMAYEEMEMLKFFGLNAANTPDPEMNCGGTGGAGGGAGGASGSGGAGGGAGGAGGAGGTTGGGGRGGSIGPGTGGAGATGGATGAGGATGSAGSGAPGSAGSTGTAGSGATGSAGTTGSAGSGATGSAGTTGNGGSVGSGGSAGPGTGGVQGGGGTTGQGGNTGAGGTTNPPDDGGSGGWCAVGGHDGRFTPLVAPFLIGLALVLRRRRRTRR
jgi:poly(hydroxyalkanoate) depolymerase family esterase